MVLVASIQGKARWIPRLSLCLLPVIGCTSDYEISKPSVDPNDVTECGFTRVEDTEFYRYDCNPVFTTTGEDWAATIDATAFYVTSVLGHPFYQLWYSGFQEEEVYGDYGLGYAVSAEGTNWEVHKGNPVLEEPGSSDWDADSIDAMRVVWDPDTEQYVMLYQGINFESNSWGLGVATSAAGHSWNRLPSNPVMDLSTGTGAVTNWCWPMGLDLGEVAGFSGYVAGARGMSNACEIHALGGSSVSSWTPTDQLVLAAGGPGDFDQKGFVSMDIATLGSTSYLFYAGFGEWVTQPGGYLSSKSHFLGMATASGGGVWQKEPGPLPLHMTSSGDLVGVAAHTVENRIHLWLTDAYEDDYAVGYFLFDPDRAAAEDGR